MYAFSPRLIGQRRLFLASGFPEGCAVVVGGGVGFFLVIPVVTADAPRVCVYECILGSYYSYITLVENKTIYKHTMQSIVFAVRKRDRREARESIIVTFFD